MDVIKNTKEFHLAMEQLRDHLGKIGIKLPSPTPQMNRYRFKLVGKGLDSKEFVVDAFDAWEAIGVAEKENPGYQILEGRLDGLKENTNT